MPYSDPMMDGVTIQRAGTRGAGARRTNPGRVRGRRSRWRAAGTPAVVMTYWNLIEHYGAGRLRP